MKASGLTECFHYDDLILAHALTGLVIGEFSRVKKTALDTFPKRGRSTGLSLNGSMPDERHIRQFKV